MTSQLFRLHGANKHSTEVEEWFKAHPDDLGYIAWYWFDEIRAAGDDVAELLHDRCPTACVGDIALAYVNAFKSHVNVGFYMGADLPDPHQQLQGSGKRMRHVKVSPVTAGDPEALKALIKAAYQLSKQFQ